MKLILKGELIDSCTSPVILVFSGLEEKKYLMSRLASVTNNGVDTPFAVVLNAENITDIEDLYLIKLSALEKAGYNTNPTDTVLGKTVIINGESYKALAPRYYMRTGTITADNGDRYDVLMPDGCTIHPKKDQCVVKEAVI